VVENCDTLSNIVKNKGGASVRPPICGDDAPCCAVPCCAVPCCPACAEGQLITRDADADADAGADVDVRRACGIRPSWPVGCVSSAPTTRSAHCCSVLLTCQPRAQPAPPRPAPLSALQCCGGSPRTDWRVNLSRYEVAIQTFLRSCAGYCVATCNRSRPSPSTPSPVPRVARDGRVY
jgi:hypothetical protein